MACAVVVATGGDVAAQGVAPAHAPRERLLIDDAWRFTRGDPPGNAVTLDYDVRPVVRDQRDDIPADAQPRAANAIGGSAQGVLKPWILPSGNDFIGDPARRHARPGREWTGDVPYLRADFDDRAWQAVTLPHDWAIAGPFQIGNGGVGGGMGRLPSPGIGWYRRKLDVPARDSGRSIFLDVDGAMSYATVWLNGRLVGGWPYGYSSWRLDLTPFVRYGGDNQLAIRLDNPGSSARWYPGGGLYRHVWLTKTTPLHVAQWGTSVRSHDVSAARATIDVDVTVDNDATRPATVAVSTTIHPLDARGRAGAAVATVASRAATIAPGASATVQGSVALSRPALWGPPPTQRPNRYAAITTVRQGTRVVDRYETRFGVRDVRFVADTGVLVNGERIALRGVNNHHDLGALGAAFNERAAERQLELLRAMGTNAVRMSHNPPAPELLALTDSLGFLVIDESFDVWERQKTPLDHHLIYADWHEDTRAMVRRDRNHPSVILWSIGNEVGEQYTDTAGARIARRLGAIVHEEDPTRPTTTAMNYAKPEMPLPGAVDVIGLNYQGEGIRQDPEFVGTERIRTPPSYEAFHARHPDKVILSTETASAFSSRGIYYFPVANVVSSPTRDGRGGNDAAHQVSSYELYAVDFGASADKVFAALDRHPFVAGEFVWTGFDYLGEPTPYYTSRSSYSGIIDLAGFPKDRFWLYQSHWRPELPMAHLLPHWTWPERVGQVTPVHVFTSGDSAELFLNDRSLGTRRRGPYEYRLRWDSVTYAPGTLRVVAYRDGRRWATDSAVTAGDAARLSASVDRSTIRADGRDLAFVTVRVTDARGITVPRASNAIRFSVSGPGEIVATDNGDATNMVSFASHEREAFSGLALVIVRARAGTAGRITVTASSDGLQPASTTIVSGSNAR